MPRHEASSPRRKEKGSDGFFALPRLLALLTVLALASTPFLPFIESGVSGETLTMKQLITGMAESGRLSVNVWLFPLALALLFLLPLFGDLRLIRGVYYLLLLEVLAVLAITLYPSVRVLLIEAGAPFDLSRTKYGFFVFHLAFPLLFLSAFLTLWQTRLGVAILVLMVASTGVLVAGNLTEWFGYLTGEPRVLHDIYDARSSDGQAAGVHVDILNAGWGALRLGAEPGGKRREVDYIVSIQRYYRVGDYWADVPFEDLITEESSLTLPAEVAPGEGLVLDLFFSPLTNASELYSIPHVGASGTYRISIRNLEGEGAYYHEVGIPPASEP